MLIFAHPDDETIALGGRIGGLKRALLLHVTDGAPTDMRDSRKHGFASLDSYRAARQLELASALEAGGAASVRRESLAIPDQQAALTLVSLTRLIAGYLIRERPQVVITHPYEGGHPDHDACAFAVQYAADLVRIARGECPLVAEATFYHACAAGIETGCFLHPEASLEARYELSPAEQADKQQMLLCFSTQEETLSLFPTTHEAFRIAPRYDFAKPPHSGAAFYDSFPWGMTSQRFCQLAIEADSMLTEQQNHACS